jgi:hypothetical protein
MGVGEMRARFNIDERANTTSPAGLARHAQRQELLRHHSSGSSEFGHWTCCSSYHPKQRLCPSSCYQMHQIELMLNAAPHVEE